MMGSKKRDPKENRDRAVHLPPPSHESGRVCMVDDPTRVLDAPLPRDPELSSEGSESDSGSDWSDWVCDRPMSDSCHRSEEEAVRIACFCPLAFSSLEELFGHQVLAHRLDLARLLQGFCASNSSVDPSYVRAKLVNYLRSRARIDSFQRDTHIQVSGDEWLDDRYLRPELEDDPLLYLEWGVAQDEFDDQDQGAGCLAEEPICVARLSKVSREELELSYAAMHRRLVRQQKQLEHLKAVLSEDAPARAPEAGDEDYFEGYAGFHIHEEMIKDEVRTSSYAKFILQNRAWFEGKVVMDVGCGTGILSHFAVMAGAKHVIAVDQSAIIEYAKEIAVENGREDRIQFIRKKVEDLTSEDSPWLARRQVDVIISEWMGYALLFESMVYSVLFARDRWLRVATGRVCPDRQRMYVVAMRAEKLREQKVDFWKQAYGIRMESLCKLVCSTPLIESMADATPISNAFMFFELDCQIAAADQVEKPMFYSLSIHFDSVIDCLVIYFDTLFTGDPSADIQPVTFSTGPESPETHWRQTVLMLARPLPVAEGSLVSGTIQFEPCRRHSRDLSISLTVCIDGQLVEKQTYRIS
ncbi:protein arginine N-methyltransferase 1-like [Schistocerca gregaria]|uniref:protein arginine N-methyltransferase 1-like n=1 Tax=Schistocerca gregaria TaxID=7010 RepID=UPI00211EC7DE|nr:protein arginine N-methyltransferase 1-like [Schistocerca gregaria]